MVRDGMITPVSVQRSWTFGGNVFIDLLPAVHWLRVHDIQPIPSWLCICFWYDEIVTCGWKLKITSTNEDLQDLIHTQWQVLGHLVKDKVHQLTKVASTVTVSKTLTYNIKTLYCHCMQYNKMLYCKPQKTATVRMLRELIIIIE